MAFKSPAESTQNKVLKALHRILPIRLQHGLRDGGGFKNIADTSCRILGAGLACSSPSLLAKFLNVSANISKHAYGQHDRQCIEKIQSSPNSQEGHCPVMVFVHGGAWGSGETWMYRIVGQGLVELGFRVLLVGYRVYPEAVVQEQIEDISLALEWISKNQAELGLESNAKIFLGGHSSGAHILALYLLQQASKSTPTPFPVAGFVGLSGVYCIHKHYLFEKARGVHEVSPMKPANGGMYEFENNSPSVLARQLPKEQVKALPPFILLHAVDDETVPFISSLELAEALESKGHPHQLIWLHQGDHFAPLEHLMFGQGSSPTERQIKHYCKIFARRYVSHNQSQHISNEPSHFSAKL